MAKTIFGLDIGSHSIKLAQLQVGSQQTKLAAYAIKDIYGPDMDYDIEGPPSRLLISAIRDAFKEIKVNPRRARNVNTALGGRSTAVKQIKSIPLAPEEMESSLIFEARKHLPLDDSEPLIDYQILEGDMDSQQMDILLVATTRKAFQARLDLLKEMGIKVNIIDTDILALVNSYMLTHGQIGSPPIIFMDIGARVTNMVITGEGAMFFARDINWAGYNFTNDIRDLKDLSYYDAEMFKKDMGIFGNGSDDGMGSSSIRVQRKFTQDNLVDETRRSLRYYTKETSIREFQKILLSGGSARIEGLAGYLSEKLGIPVELYSPTDVFEIPQVFNTQHAPQLAIACGLALREE